MYNSAKSLLFILYHPGHLCSAQTASNTTMTMQEAQLKLERFMQLIDSKYLEDVDGRNGR